MSKSIKLKDNNYWDSTGITHNKELLSTILDKYKNYPIYRTPEISKTNGRNFNNIVNDLPSNTVGALILTVVNSCEVAGAPNGAYNWGLLISFKITQNFNYFVDTQIYIPDESNGSIYVKTRNQNRTSGQWRRIIADSRVNDYS